MLEWHAMESAQVTGHFNVNPVQGLDESEAAARLRTYGPNRPSVRPGRSPFSRFASQLVQPLILVLIAAGTVTVFLREWVDASVIFGVAIKGAVVELKLNELRFL